MNDDLVQPDRGFGAHPHRNVEICTYIVHGSLTHQDSMGTKETLNRGAIQFMTAGSGVTHSEHNLDKTNPLRFIQIWFSTRSNNLPPNYGSSVGNSDARKNQWLVENVLIYYLVYVFMIIKFCHIQLCRHHMVSDVKGHSATDIKINQDANIFVTELDIGKSTEFTVGNDRQAYLLCIEGQASVSFGDSCVTLDQHDASEVLKGGTLKVEATGSDSESSGAHILMIEMAYQGPGRSDL